MKKLLAQSIGYAVVGLALFLFLTFGAAAQTTSPTPAASPAPAALPAASLTLPVQLPPLPYDFAALDPYIDAQTMQIHHDRHHGTYVERLNGILEKYPNLRGQNVVTMLQDLDQLPEDIRTVVRNNGGGHINHSMFWQIMAPNAGGAPTGALATAINRTFGSFDQFKEQFNKAGADRFGSGWAWLVLNSQNQLQIISTPNQDSPIMSGLYPVMGNDVWEHAYYLKYQNRRPEYLTNWWNTVNWTEVNRRYTQASGVR